MAVFKATAQEMGIRSHSALLTPSEMAEADRLTIAAGVSGFTLMQHAGRAVAAVAARLAPEGRVLVLAGPGKNGGDGFVAATELMTRGRDVRVLSLGDPSRLAGDAGLAAHAYKGPLEPLRPGCDLDAGLVIDALFGAGLTRPLDGEAAAAVEALNASTARVLAVDLPSGIDGLTGEARGAAVRADATVTFFRLKPGHLLLPGRAYCGDVECPDIGIDPAVLATIRPSLFHNGPAFWGARLPLPSLHDHKYARGHVFVVSGPATATGAARLSAAGAARAGAGAVTVLSPPDALLVNAAHLTSTMVRRFDGVTALAEILADPRRKAVVIGPGNGLGKSTRANVEAALASTAPVVLDADALTSCAPDRAAVFRTIAARSAPVVLTPHEGEFARLFSLAGSKVERARAAARESGAIVVLKGADTVIAHPEGTALINSNAPPDLATAGSGDVLAGITAALLAQGMAGLDAAAAAVWLHGAAGAALGRGLIADDLPAALPAVLRQLYRDGR